MAEKDILILAIESSCDETAAAVVKNGREVLSNVISSQIALHTLYGGVVPEKHATGYPGCNPQGGAIWSEDTAVTDGNLITGKGPGAAAEFSIAIIRYLEGDAKADAIRTSTMMP